VLTLTPPSSDATAAPVATTRRAARPSPARRRARAAVALTLAAVVAGCLPPGSTMPAVTTAHVSIPATPVAAVPNLVLDGATFDSIASAACATSPVPDSATFFGSFLGEHAVGDLAGRTTTLDQQRALLGAAFTSGYFGGRDIHDHAGVFVDTSTGSPFAALTPLINSSTSIAVLNQLVGQVLLTANGPSTSVTSSIAAMAPLLATLAAAAQQDFGATDVPESVRPLLASVAAATQSTLAAAAAGASGDVVNARRAESAAAGLLAWAGGYFFGLTATTPIATPTFTC
jgi:hypothetical protein